MIFIFQEKKYIKKQLQNLMHTKKKIDSQFIFYEMKISPHMYFGQVFLVNLDDEGLLICYQEGSKT